MTVQEYDVEDSILPVQPSLNYTAPELVRSKGPSAGSSSDIFSFGCLAYHLVARKPLFDCNNNVKMVILKPELVNFDFQIYAVRYFVSHALVLIIQKNCNVFFGFPMVGNVYLEISCST